MQGYILNIKKNWPFVRFILIAMAIFLLWSLFTAFFVTPGQGIDYWLVSTEGNLSSHLLNLLGYPTFIILKKTQCILFLQERRLIHISNSCNALSLIVLYIGFLLAYPGNVRNKIVFILSGSILIYFINIIRISALALIGLKAPEWLDFNHHFTFTALVYSIVFILWVIFVNKFSNTNPTVKVE